MIKDVTEEARLAMKKAAESTVYEFVQIRTGRASTAVFEKIMVDHYGTQTPIHQMATMSVPEPMMVVIQPWDKSAMSAIEKAIQSSDLGFNPSNDGTVIRVAFPPLNEERRRELVKHIKKIAEEHKVSIRNIRRSANDRLKAMESSHEISKDDLERAEHEIQDLTNSYSKEIDSMVERKEAEIMEV